MMQIVAKDRLDKVSSILKKLKIRFPVAEISKKLDIDKGMTSAYLSGKKPMSDNFYSSFMKEYGSQIEEKNININDSAINDNDSSKNDNLDSLIRSNEMLSRANMDLASSSLELAKLFSSHVGSKISPNVFSNRNEIRESLAEDLYKDGTFLSQQEAVLILDKILTLYEKKVLKIDKKNAWDK